MGIFRRRPKDDAAYLRPGRVPAPPPHEPVIDPTTGLPGYVRVRDERAAEPEPQTSPVLTLPDDAPPPVSDPDEQLRRLDDLRERGLLDDGEFAEQRRRLLGA